MVISRITADRAEKRRGEASLPAPFQLSTTSFVRKADRAYDGARARGANGPVTTDIFIFSVLLLINALMALAMLLASRTLGQPRVALLLAAAFGGNVLLYISDAAYHFLYSDNIWLNLAVSAIAMLPPICAASAYRLRSGLPFRIGILAASYLVGMLLILWFSIGSPNPGLRGAVVPIYAAAILMFGVTAMWRPGRTLRLGERPIIITGCGLAAIELAGGLVLAASGNSESKALDDAYTLIIFLGLPAMTVAAGIFSLYLLAGDLAERLRVAADTDSLTGAPNRRAIEANGTRLLAEARLSGEPLAVAICDVDHFKDINDVHGHGLGDDVLCRLARLFRDHVSAPDHYGRFGGEEFVLYFPGADLDEAHRRVEALRDQITAMSDSHLPTSLTASFGVAAMSANDHILADIVKRADRALYASKQAGRNRTTIDRPATAAE